MDYRVKHYGETTVLVRDGGSEDGTRSHRTRRKPRSYKPIAIRLPILALFAAILAFCIGLIEVLLHGASKPNVSQPQPSAAQNTPRPRAIIKKSEAGPTCQDLPALTSSFSSLNGIVATLCSTYSQSYPTGVRLGLNQSAVFQQWLLTFSSWEASRDAAYTAADQAYGDCENKKLPADFDQAISNVQYIGCSTTSLEQGCYGAGSIYMTDGTVTVASSEWCAATQGDILTLTSQSTTSSASLPNEGITGTLTGGNELTLTSQSTTSASPAPTLTQGNQLTLTSQSTTSSASPPGVVITGTLTGGNELTLTSQSTTSSTSPPGDVVTGTLTQGNELTLTSQSTSNDHIASTLTQVDQLTLTSQPTQSTSFQDISIGDELTLTSQSTTGSTSIDQIAEIPTNIHTMPTPTQGNELTLTTQSTISSTSSPGDVITGTLTGGNELTLTSQSTTSSTSSSGDVITGTLTGGNELTLTSQSTSTTYGYLSQGGLLTLTSQSTSGQTTISETVAAPPSDILSLASQSSTETAMSSAADSAVILTLTSQSTGNRIAPAESSSTITTEMSSSTSFNEIPQFSQKTSLSASITIIITKSDSTSVSSNLQSTDASEPVSTMTTTFLSTIQTTDAFGRNTSVVAVIIEPTVETFNPSVTSSDLLTLANVTSSSLQIKITKASSSPPTSINTHSTTSSTTVQRPLSTLTTSEEIVNRKFDSFSYVAAMYLPTVIAVIIKIIWEIIYAAFKMIEPFRRLNKPNGTPAKRSLFAQYLSNTISLDAIKAAVGGHSLSILTTCVYLFVTMLATLAASSMTIRATAMNCDIGNNQHMRCNPVWVIDTTILRIVEALLGASFVFTISTLFLMVGYRSGIPWNPSSIASIANLINQEDLLQELRAVEPLATEEEFAAVLKYSRYRLAPYENTLGEYRYGIVNMSGPTIVNKEYLQTSDEDSVRRWFGGYSSVANPASSSAKTEPHRYISRNMEARILDSIQLLSSAAIFAVVLTNWFDSRPDAFNNFVNSGKLPARLVFVGLASFLDMQWKRLEREVRITEPYRRMAKGFARPETTVLLSLNGTCWSQLPNSLFMGLRYRHMWFQLLVSFMAVLSDFCIIAISSVLWSEGQIIPSLRISSYVAMAISGLMILVMLITMIWWRRGIVTGMPRTPDTIGVVASYLCASNFTRSMSSGRFQGVKQHERDELIIDAGWRFSFGLRIGVDGRERWCVDFDTAMDTMGNEERVRERERERPYDQRNLL